MATTSTSVHERYSNVLALIGVCLLLLMASVHRGWASDDGGAAKLTTDPSSNNYGVRLVEDRRGGGSIRYEIECTEEDSTSSRSLLSIDHCSPLTMETVQNAAVFPGNVSFRLGVSPKRDNSAFDVTALRNLDHLWQLSIWICGDSTAKNKDFSFVDNLACLAGHRNLVRLSIEKCRISVNTARNIASIPRLANLKMRWCRFDDDALSELAKMKELRSLDLQGSKFSDSSLSALDRCPKLISLQLQDSTVTEKAFPPTLNWPCLQAINLRSTHFSGEGIKNLKSCRNLKYLSIEALDIKSDQVRTLLELPGSLEAILVPDSEEMKRLPRKELKPRILLSSWGPSFRGGSLDEPFEDNLDITFPNGLSSADDCKAMLAIRNLKGKFISCTVNNLQLSEVKTEVMTDLGRVKGLSVHLKSSMNKYEWNAMDVDRFAKVLQAWTHSSYLQELCINDPCPIGQEFFQCLENMRSIQALDLIGTGAPDAITESLVRMPRLERLRLMESAITDQGVETLAKCPSLKFLDISYTKVSHRCLHYLPKMPFLKEVVLLNTPVSLEVAQTLRERGLNVTTSQEIPPIDPNSSNEIHIAPWNSFKADDNWQLGIP